MFTPEIEQNAVKANRIYFLDNLRTFMIFLVVLIHAGGVMKVAAAGRYSGLSMTLQPIICLISYF